MAATSSCWGLGSTTTSESCRISSRDAKPATCGASSSSVMPKWSAYPCSSVVLRGDPGVEARQVVGVQREAVLVLLGGRADDAEAEGAHFFLGMNGSLWSVFPAAFACFSARFSLMDFPDFLDMPCRGDLSLIEAPR